jgi:hypothetical protein
MGRIRWRSPFECFSLLSGKILGGLLVAPLLIKLPLHEGTQTR